MRLVGEADRGSHVSTGTALGKEPARGAQPQLALIVAGGASSAPSQLPCPQYAGSPADRRAHQRSRPPAAGDAVSVRFDTKIAIAVRADLAAWQKLNVTAFLASRVAASLDGLAGKPYEDASGNRYLPMFRQPVLVYAGEARALAAARERALGRGLPVAIYTEELFGTGNDDDNRAAVSSVAAADLRLAGLAV